MNNDTTSVRQSYDGRSNLFDNGAQLFFDRTCILNRCEFNVRQILLLGRLRRQCVTMLVAKVQYPDCDESAATPTLHRFTHDRTDDDG
jgi:hypothetical protein